jgi:hypothetical protein
MAAIRIVAAFAGLAVLAGCVSVQNIPLTPAAGEGLKDREITLAVRDKPDFSAMRAPRAPRYSAAASSPPRSRSRRVTASSPRTRSRIRRT